MGSLNDLHHNILFRDLSDDDFNTLLKISNKITIEDGNYFIYEGETAESFYLILKGNVAITKSTQQGNEHIIANLGSGDSVGEMALIDHQPRSASAKAISQVELLCFSLDELRQMANKSPIFDKIISQIIKSMSSRMRETNTLIVTELEMRAGLGLFLINVVVALCLFTFFLSWITNYAKNVIENTVITLPLTLCFIILCFSIMNGSKLPLSTFGLTLRNWRKAIFESIFFTFLLCLLLPIVKLILIHTTNQYAGHQVFELYRYINIQNDSTFTKEGILLISVGIYALIVIPLQELIARGGLQGPLEVFLTGKYRVLKAILVSNLMFSTGHLFLGINISVLVFFAGLYFGWLYSRHHTLIGVILAHMMLGVCAGLLFGT